jgi:hypothetical protein
MSEPIGYDSRSILEYVPDIGYVEPDVVSEEPENLHAEFPDPVDHIAEAKAVQKLAQNVEKIAAAVQQQADQLSAGFEVELNPKTDFSTISALRRQYPKENSKKITYDQYKKCKDHLREVANGVSDKVLGSLSEDNLKKELAALERNDVSAILESVSPGMRNDSGQRINTNRPEDDALAMLIDPIDIDEFQDLILRHLINSLWKKFIKPVVAAVVPGGSMLPDEIASLPKGSPSSEEMMGK